GAGAVDGSMRIVLVNHLHPSVPHVSGMRAWFFARELAARGHQVILICEWRPGAQAAPHPSDIGTQLDAHDWRSPLVVAIKPEVVAALARVRARETARLLRKMLVVWSYVRHSGMFTDFSRGAQPYLAPIAGRFKPTVVWGIAGNTNCWLIAQRLARLSGCRWVSDLKDAWDAWMPFGLRTLIARRFRDMAAATANSQFNADVFQRWFSMRPEIVYSGATEDWLGRSPSRAEGFRVMLMGAIYQRRNLERLVRGFAQWVQSVPAGERHQIVLCYAGSDAASVESATAELAGLVRVDIRGQVPLEALASLCRGAAVNMYLWSDATFHHKLIELLCHRRPIISFPGERPESVELAQRVGGSLSVCGDEGHLQNVLSQVWAGGLQPTGEPERLLPLTWASQADLLEATLRRAATEAPTCAH
ncbi:MAG TPA: hypothetical protein VM536_04655, partial [Chloroflexia bacterium]|nr:hypothetical protein [Chloroflexia bacterium]